MFYDTVTALRRFGGIGSIRLESHEYAKIPSRFTRIYSEILHESVKNTPKASTNHVRIKGTSSLFLTIKRVVRFSLLNKV